MAALAGPTEVRYGAGTERVGIVSKGGTAAVGNRDEKLVLGSAPITGSSLVPRVRGLGRVPGQQILAEFFVVNRQLVKIFR